MSKNTEQRIMVYCDFSESMADAILHGIRIAEIFRKELCLFHPLGKGGKTEKMDAQRALAAIIRKLQTDLPNLVISSLTLKGNLQQTIDRIAEQYDGIMLVLTGEKIKTKLPALQQSQIPFLFVKGSDRDFLQYNKVMLPVDFRKVMKDTSLWASYFGRFNQSSIEVMVAKDKNNEYGAMTKKNKRFIEELLFKLHLDVRFRTAQKGSFGLPFEALDRCREDDCRLIIIPSSRHISLIDLMVGLPEKKIIQKAGNMPVLCINPKRDMYILCD
ncbi:hypothetical protein [Gaoshiqia sp. Z1-71]|uniref:hypothetical protein n=1 Tax=Gaoshiqia hydrogeniformans TaxID=3290090 RepID=UPI003BF7F834